MSTEKLHDKAAHKFPMKISIDAALFVKQSMENWSVPGINFTNILLTAFMYVSCMRSFFVLTF
jgi:hypothetical protein